MLGGHGIIRTLGGHGTIRTLGGGAVFTSSALRERGLQTASVLGCFGFRGLSTSTLSTKQQMGGVTIRDKRQSRPRVAKEKRKSYLAERTAAFEAEQEKAMSLGLDWGVRSAL